MQRNRGRIALALAASLALGVLGGTPALAGNTRTVFFGSPGTASQMPPGLGVLATTDVTAGGATAVDVILQNLSPSQLTHVVIQGGGAAPNPLANASFPPPSQICPAGVTDPTQCLESLPDGTQTYAGVKSGAMTYGPIYADTASTVLPDCSGSTSTSLSCTVPNMGPNALVRIRIILKPTGAAGNLERFWLATDLKEGTSNTGQNQDTFFAYGSFNVLQPSCSEIANFFDNQQGVQIANNQAGSCDQTSNISARNSDFSLVKFGQGAFSSTGSTDPKTDPKANWCTNLGLKTCFGTNSIANVNFGVNPDGTYILWDVTWDSTALGNGKPSGVVHFWDTYDPNNPLHNKDYNLIPFKGSYQCKTATQTNCWTFAGTVSIGFEAIFRTPNNGVSHGF